MFFSFRNPKNKFEKWNKMVEENMDLSYFAFSNNFPSVNGHIFIHCKSNIEIVALRV